MPLPSSLKVWVLRLFGAKIGNYVVIRSYVNITFPWRLKLGDHVWLGDEVGILTLGKVEIGSHTCISQRAYLCTGTHDYTKETFDLVVKPIRIEEGCWVGAMAFVGPGVHLKKNTICAAGSVVIKDAGPNEVIGGNPGKVVKRLEARDLKTKTGERRTESC